MTAEPISGLPDVEAFLTRVLEAGSRPPPEVLRRRVVADLALVHARHGPERRVSGVLLLYALTDGAVRAIEDTVVVRGGQLADDQLLNVDASAAEGAVHYLSVIAADVGHRRTLVADLWALLEARRARTLYSRPSTPEGHRLFERTGFVPVGARSEIWRLALPVGVADPGQ